MNRLPKILIVGEHVHCAAIEVSLSAFYDVKHISIIDTSFDVPKFDLILINDMSLDAYGLSSRIRKKYTNVPIVIITRMDSSVDIDYKKLEHHVFQSGANNYIVKPFTKNNLLKVISNTINAKIEKEWKKLPEIQQKTLDHTLHLVNDIANLVGKTDEIIDYVNIKDTCSPLIDIVSANDYQSLLNSIKNYDNAIFAHSLKVSMFLTLFGNFLGLSKSEQLVLASGGILHDVGFLTIPAEIRRKNNPSDTEKLLLQTHVEKSVEILKKQTTSPEAAIVIAAQHHERADGSGYPKKLKGSEINELAMMAAIVDEYCNLTDDRLSSMALTIMTTKMADKFDHLLLKKFKTIIDTCKMLH